MLSRASEVQPELERILESRWLRESAQLSSLLRYIVDETIAGRQDGLKEYSLGLAVFHRPPDYDPRSDAIVRVQASLLRKRLASYYENEGRTSPLRIDVPRGGYVPVLHNVQLDTPPPQPPKPAPFPFRHFFLGLLAGALLLSAAFLLLRPGRRPPPVPAPSLWGAFVSSPNPAVVSFGIPLFYIVGNGIYVRDVQVNTPGDENKGQLAKLAAALQSPIRPQEDVYTGIGDLVGTHEVIRFLESHAAKATLANSHDLGHSDISARNLIVISSVRFQTLLQEMNLPRQFRFESSLSGAFVIDHPLPGEQKAYQPMSGTGVDTSFAVISLWPGQQPSNRILYISGITTWATQGAAQFAVNPAKLAALQRTLDADPPQGPRGRKGPFFQVLLRLEGKNNFFRTVNYVTHRYLP